MAITYQGTSAVVVTKFTLHEQSSTVKQTIVKVSVSFFIDMTPLIYFLCYYNYIIKIKICQQRQTDKKNPHSIEYGSLAGALGFEPR